jgi:Zn-dependent protease
MGWKRGVGEEGAQPGELAAVAAQAGRRSGTWKLGSVWRIELSIHWSWFVIAGLLTSSVATMWLPVVQPGWSAWRSWPVAGVCALLFFASILLHELAHATVARARGIPVLGITLFLFGGVLRLGAEPSCARDEFWVAVVGPLSSFGLMLLFTAAYLGAQWAQLHVVATVCFYLALVNFTVAVFNLLPGFPLDGGRILRSGIWKVRGDFGAATRISGAVGQVIAGGLIALGIWLLLDGALGGLWMAFLGAFLWAAGGAQMKQLA